MLIINNGVPKSGSTWVQRILEQGIDPAFPDEKWRNSWKNPSIDPKDLRAYVESEEWKDRPTLIKMHITYLPEHDYLIREDVKVVVSYRNIADSVVSWFHHQVRQEKADLSKMTPWCRSFGRQFAMRAMAHRLSWSRQPNVVPVGYEKMLANGPEYVAYLLAAVNQPRSKEDCAKIVDATQVRLKEGAPLREGMHVRTAGRSVAHEELSDVMLSEFNNFEQSIPLQWVNPEPIQDVS